MLEVGCGAGNILQQIEGAQLFGIDLSDYILEKAQRRLGARAELCKADAGRLPYSDATFDRVYCSEVLEHVLDPRAVLAEMRRVLRCDGIAAVSVPNERAINCAKDLLAQSALLRRLVLRPGQGGYESAQRMDDQWHLRAYNTAMLRSTVEGLFSIDRLSAVPSPLLPLRLVAKLRPH